MKIHKIITFLWFYCLLLSFMSLKLFMSIIITRMLYTGEPLNISSKLYIQWHHIGGLKSVMVKVFIPWKSVNHYESGLNLLFCWLLRLRKVMEDMLVVLIKIKSVSCLQLLHCENAKCSSSTWNLLPESAKK